MAKNDEYVNLVTESFDIAAEARKPHEKKWDEYFRLSRGIVDKRPKKWMTNYFVPYTPAIIDIVASRLAGRKISGSVVGETEEAEIREWKFNRLLDKQQDDLDAEYLVSLWIQESIRYGSSFLKVGWKKERAEHLKRSKKMIDRIKEYFLGLGEEITEDDLLYDGPTLELVDVFDLFFHPQATTVEDSRFIIHRREMSKDQILKNPNFKKNLDQVKALTGSNAEIGEYRKKRLQAAGLNKTQVNRIMENISDDYLEVLEYRGLYDVDKDGADEEVVITVINRQVCVQFEENPYYLINRPYVHLPYRPDPHFLYGISLVENLKDSQYMLNDIANQSGDNRKLAHMPVIKVKKTANLDLRNLKIAPGIPIVLEDVNDLVFERPPDFTAQLEFMGRATRQIMQVAAGINDATLGISDTGLASDTLGGAQLAEEQTALRFRIPALNIDKGIQDLMTMLIALNQQNFDRAKTLKIFGENKGIRYQDIKPHDLVGKFSYSVNPHSTGSRSQLVRRNELVQLKQLYSGDPEKNLESIDRQLIETYGVDPETIMEANGDMNLDKVREMVATMSPEQLQQYMAQLKPQDRELLERALGELQGGDGGTGQSVQSTEGTSGQIPA